MAGFCYMMVFRSLGCRITERAERKVYKRELETGMGEYRERIFGLSVVQKRMLLTCVLQNLLLLFNFSCVEER